MPDHDDHSIEDAAAKDPLSRSNLALQRFLASMEMNYDKWHDGIGYDLEALDEMSKDDKDMIVDMISRSLEEPWRSFEALKHINTPKALAIIESALRHPTLEVRIAAMRFVDEADRERERILIEALEKSDLYAGLSQALDEVQTFHPPGVVDALLKGLLRRGGSAAVNFAGMLLYIHGKAESAFDWNHRPLFLRFDTSDLTERKKAFANLCGIIGIDPVPYLNEHENGSEHY